MSVTSLLPPRPSGQPPSGGRWAAFWERLDRPDSAALHGLVSGAVWFVIGVTLGITMSEELVTPDFLAGIPYLVFSRLRPTHVNVVLFGFLSTSFYGAWYYIVPRLCKVPLRTNRMANILLYLWNFAVVVGAIAIACGDNKGKEWAELPWYINWPVEILLVVNIFIIYGTIAARREPKLYVSLWYIGGTLVWITMMYAIGNTIWHPFTTYYTLDGHMHILWDSPGRAVLPNAPFTNFQRSGSLIGLDDAVWNWFYGHNVLGLFVTTGGIAIVYYIVPKLARRPLYSHTLSLIGFWAIALFYAPTGQHHLLQAPIPNWLKIIATVGSIALIIPVFAFGTNIFMTMRGEWGQLLENIPLRFVLTGAFFYLAVSFQGSLQSLMVVNRFIHYTQWVIAHAHLALLGAFGFIASGAILYMVPQVVRRPLWSRNLADAQFWLMFVGLSGFFWVLTFAGLAQASAAVTLGEQWVKLYPVVKPYFAFRSLFGGMIVVGVYMQLVNIIMTLRTPAPDAATLHLSQIAHLQEIPAAPSPDGRAAILD